MPVKFVGKSLKPVDITGYLMPWYVIPNQPVLVFNALDRTEKPLLPIFTTSAKLEMALTWLRTNGEISIKQIEDGREFLDSIGDKAIVAIDIFQKDGGKYGFMGVFLDE